MKKRKVVIVLSLLVSAICGFSSCQWIDSLLGPEEKKAEEGQPDKIEVSALALAMADELARGLTAPAARSAGPCAKAPLSAEQGAALEAALVDSLETAKVVEGATMNDIVPVLYDGLESYMAAEATITPEDILPLAGAVVVESILTEGRDQSVAAGSDLGAVVGLAAAETFSAIAGAGAPEEVVAVAFEKAVAGIVLSIDGAGGEAAAALAQAAAGAVVAAALEAATETGTVGLAVAQAVAAGASVAAAQCAPGGTLAAEDLVSQTFAAVAAASEDVDVAELAEACAASLNGLAASSPGTDTSAAMAAVSGGALERLYGDYDNLPTSVADAVKIPGSSIVHSLSIGPGTFAFTMSFPGESEVTLTCEIAGSSLIGTTVFLKMRRLEPADIGEPWYMARIDSGKKDRIKLMIDSADAESGADAVILDPSKFVGAGMFNCIRKDAGEPFPLIQAGEMVTAAASVPAIWRNGSCTLLEIPAGLQGLAYGPASIGGSLYAAGYTWANGVPYAPALWKDGAYQALAMPAGSSSGYAYGVAAYGGRVLVAGMATDASGIEQAVLWRDGAPELVEPGVGCVGGALNGIAAFGTDLYFTGYAIDADRLQVPCYWKNATPTRLAPIDATKTGGRTNAILVDAAGRVHVAGRCRNSGNVDAAAYWLDGSLATLPVIAQGKASRTRGLVIAGGDVIITGYCTDAANNKAPVYWRNGVLVPLDTGATPAVGEVNAAVIVGESLYFSGYLKSDSAYLGSTTLAAIWIDGVPYVGSWRGGMKRTCGYGACAAR